MKPPRYSIALLSAAALAYEVTLTRLFSIAYWHHFAYMIISLALLGYGASGTFLTLAADRLLRRFPLVYVANLLLFAATAIGCYLAAQRVPFSPEELLWDPGQPLRLLTIYLLLALPFFFAANAIGLVLMRHSARSPSVYAADLLGAGLGSLLVILLLFTVFPQTAVRVLGAAGIGAAALAWWELGLGRRGGLILVLAATLPFALPNGWMNPSLSPYKGLSQALQVPGARVVKERSSPLGLLTVVEHTRVPLRHAPGLSLMAMVEPPPQLAVFTDGDAMTAINRYAGDPQELAFLDQLSSAVPYHLTRPRQVLVLGAGGGSEVLQALYHGVPRIEAVELNPQMVELVRKDYGPYGGHLFDRPGVRVHVSEARGFVTASADRYDLIQMALVDSFATAAAGLYALNESYLYTIEAMGAYLDHLEPGGLLALTRWVQLPPRDTLKLFATAVAALEASGVADPGRRLALIRGWQTGTLLVKNGGFTPQELATLRRFCDSRGFDIAYYPGMKAGEANRRNRLARPYFFEGTTALLGPDRQEFMDRYKFDIEPATDDRPYFFRFFKWSALPEILGLLGSGGMGLLESGYLVLAATIGQALVASLVLIALPLLTLRRGVGRGHSEGVSRRRVLVYFFSIGLGFLFLEMAFIQRFILLLSHPVYAVAAALGAFLVFAGLGSAVSGRLAAAKGNRGVVVGAVTAILLLGLASALTSEHLFSALAGLPIATKIPLAVAFVAPLAFAMGMPFPLAIAQLGIDAPGLVPWAWAVNGCASVISAVLATLLAIHGGFSIVVLLALALYGAAAASFPKARPGANQGIAGFG